MNKNFNLGARQQRYNTVNSMHRQKRQDSLETLSSFSTRSGYIIFSYKGIVIERRQGAYQVAKRIVISGFPVNSLEGQWTDARLLKGAIEHGLANADPDRHKAVMAQYRNWQCPCCSTVALVDSKDIHTKWKYKTDEWGQEEKIDTGVKLLACNYCSEEVNTNDIPFVESDVFL